MASKVLAWDPDHPDGQLTLNSLNFDSTFVIRSGLPGMQPQMLERTGVGQMLTGAAFTMQLLSPLEITIIGPNPESLKVDLHRRFDGKDMTSKQLIIDNDDLSLPERYILAYPIGMVQKASTAGYIFVVSLVADGAGDPHYRWRKTTPTTQVWNITASGQTVIVNNQGQDEAYPKYTIRPTSAKSAGYAWKRWIPVRWNAAVGATKYPVDIVDNSFDTASLISSKMQADGDDLRVWVDGVEVDRWLQDINTSTTQVWCNLDYQAKVEMTTADSIASSGSVSTIDFNENITNLPSSGIIVIDSEAFVYTGKNDALRRITGVTRASRGTSMAAHSAGATAWWVQHDIWIFYGNSAATAPAVDDNNKPAFLLSSTNTSWDYDDFYEADGLRAAQWVKITSAGAPIHYTGNQSATANPAVEIGIFGEAVNVGLWQVTVPTGILSANFQNGEQAVFTLENNSLAYIVSKGTGAYEYEYLIPHPTAANVWQAWSRNETLATSSTVVGLSLGVFGAASQRYIEVADVTLALNSANTPTSIIGAEQANYLLDCILENVTYGESMRITFTMGVNQDLEIDTDQKTVTYLVDGSSQLGARTLAEGARLQWLPLRVANNQLRFTDAGTTGVTVTIEYEERYYT